jgi:hypothetical protein
MNLHKNSQNDTNPGTRAAVTRPTTWDDDLPLDHHIEEMLGAFARIGLNAPAEASV